MGARKHNPGTSPRRGVLASVVVGVRLTPDEAARLDALGTNRGETIRRLITDTPTDAEWAAMRVSLRDRVEAKQAASDR